VCNRGNGKCKEVNWHQQTLCWRFSSSGVWVCSVGSVFPNDVQVLPSFSNANSARTVVPVLRTLKMTAVWPFETPGTLSERNSVISQKIWIFNETAVRTSNLATNLLLFASDSLVDKRKIEFSADCGSYPWFWAHAVLIRYTSELTGTWLPRALYVTPKKRICRLKLDKIYRRLWRQATVDFVFLDTW
jgi:hypothetical protein